MAFDINAFLQSTYAWIINFLQELFPKYILPNLQFIIQIILIIVVGYIAGRISKAVVKKILYVVGLRRLTARTFTEDVLKASGYKGDVVEFIGDLVKWSIYILTLAVVVQVLGFTTVAGLFNQIIIFVPKLILAILVIIIGFMVADFFGKVFEEGARKLLREDILAKFSGGLMKYSVSMIAIIIALGLIGLDINAMLIFFSALLAVIVIVFSLGLRDLIPNFTAGIHLKNTLKVGDKVKVGKYSGVVERIDPFSVLLRVNRKNVIIPNSLLIKEPVEKELRER
ncbi:MAG: mechanosensitive ion channel [Candidatus Aenigmatarchaeota archaeon]|nr:MAG: mechanosensitive ion channel [Candidatus Aenigmarchaeota archaeon]